MIPSISHSRDEETWEAKVRWFQSLSIEQRMQLLCDYTDLILSFNPDLPRLKKTDSLTGRIQILTKP